MLEHKFLGIPESEKFFHWQDNEMETMLPKLSADDIVLGGFMTRLYRLRYINTQAILQKI